MSGTGLERIISVDGGPPRGTGLFPRRLARLDKHNENPFIDGRDFGTNDTFPGVAIVNETFARRSSAEKSDRKVLRKR